MTTTKKTEDAAKKVPWPIVVRDVKYGLTEHGWQCEAGDGHYQLSEEGLEPLSLLDQFGVEWVNRGSTDFPLHRVTLKVRERYGIRTVADLDKVPFTVLWPPK